MKNFSQPLSMQVTCLSVSGRPQILEVHCDGELWRTIHSSIFGRNPKFTACHSLDELSELFHQLEYRFSKQFALKRLSARSLSSSMLIRALQQRLVSQPTIQRIVEEFSQLGYLNDKEWASTYARYQKDRKLGPRAIAQKLAVKGVNREEIKSALAEYDPEEQKQAINKLLKTHYHNRNLEDFRERQKVIGSLMRRGFELDLIRMELDCHIE